MVMNLQTFNRGGIHPPDRKALAKDKPIQILMPKEGSLLVYPMSQHIGAPCEPVVAKGDRVLVGQKIAEAGGFVSAPIHASVSGTVKDIKPMATPSGAMVKSIIIENDGLYEEDPSIGKDTDYESFSNEKILEKVKEAGIDYRLLMEQPEKVVKGLEIILKLFPDATGYIAIENNKPDAIEKVVKTVGNNPRIKVLALMTKYPQGSEKQLINAVTGREVPSGALPANAGCIVDNVDTVVAIETAVCEDRPLMRRIVTLTGKAANNPGNYEIRIGMNMNELIEMAGGLNEDLGKIIAGGPMMGPAMFSTDCPFIKTSSALLCLTKKDAELPPESNCIRCAKCINACPMGLMPAKLNKLALAKDYEGFAANNGLDCIECGSCSYVCPAKRHLTQTLRICKRETMAIMRAKAQKK